MKISDPTSTALTIVGMAVVIMLIVGFIAVWFRDNPAVGVIVLVLLAAVAAGGGQAVAKSRDKQVAASAAAKRDIPPAMLTRYKKAARHCPGLSWTVLAGIGRVETNHGKSNARGVHRGENYAGAGGPMQFIGPTWRAYGYDADGNGKADRYDPDDATVSAARYLCANGAGNKRTLRRAIWHYNHSTAYVNLVLRHADRYKAGAR